MPFQQFTKRAKEAVQKAHEYAATRGQSDVGSVHLLAALLSQEEGLVVAVLQKIGVDTEDMLNDVLNILDSQQGDTVQTDRSSFLQFFLSPELAQVFEGAMAFAKRMKATHISTEHLFLGIINHPGTARNIIEEYDISLEQSMKALESLMVTPTGKKRGQHTRFLDKYTKNLTRAAAENLLDPVIGRDTEIARMIQILSRRTKNNPILVGEAGTGKTALVEGLAQRIIRGEVPESMRDKQLLQLDLGQLVAGTKFRGEFEERLRSLQKELENAPDSYILFVDEMHTLVGAGSAEGSMDASNLLKPALARGQVRLIGATTIKEYQQHIEKDAALTRRFQSVYVTEPSLEDAIAILRGLREKYETFHGVRITDEAIVAAAHLSSRYISDRHLPDKAIDLVDEAASSLRVSLESKPDVLEEAQRKIMRLEIEREALKRDLQNKKDRKTSMRVKDIEREIADLSESTKELDARWRSEKDTLTEMKRIQKQVESMREEGDRVEAVADFSRTAEIRYNIIPQLEKKYKEYGLKLKKVQQERRLLKEEVDETDIASIVSRWTGVPVSKMLESEMKKLARMDEALKKRVVGQEEAVELITDAIRRSRTGISDPNRPIGSFMFLGPTGVGKTELSKQIASFLFDDKNALIRVDMSEYMEPHSVSKLIGAPPGYIGYEESGKLTEAVRHRPYSIVLFDEVEKAHPDVFNILLQVLDAGRLTDAKGRSVNFKNTIIILTSNIGSEHLVSFSSIGFEDKKQKTKESLYLAVKDKVMDVLVKSFRPEFLNRLDEIVVFKPLEQNVIKKIVHHHLDDVVKRLNEKGIEISFTPEVTSKLAKDAYNPEYGARPLRRRIQTDILNPVARFIVNKEVAEGGAVFVSVGSDNTYAFENKKRKAGKKYAAVKKR